MIDVPQTDLLGDPIKVRFGDGKKFLKNRKPIERRGYAWKPGTGPEGQTCATCKHAQRYRRWAKCGHSSAPRKTGGMGTDIRLRSPACKFWEKAQ